MGVLIPSVMALRETAMTAPLGQQGEPLRFFDGSRMTEGDCHTSDIGHWFAMTPSILDWGKDVLFHQAVHHGVDGDGTV